MQTVTATALQRKIFGAALFAQTIRAPGFSRNLTGPAPKNQSEAEAKMKGQTSPDMPFVRVTDLTKTAGNTVSVDMFNTIGGKPIMGDRNAEGKGEKLSSSSMDIKIDVTTKSVDAGGKMAQQATIHNLRSIAMAQLSGWFPKLDDQTSLVHVAGARGSQTGVDWIVPLTSDVDFSEIVVNPVKAPTYNRHYVIDGSNLIAGGQQLASIDSTDLWSLDHIDALSLLLNDMEFPLHPVKIADDPAANDEPIKAVLYLSARQWQSILTNAAGSSNNWRTFLQNAWNRKSYGSKHTLFSGEPGLWNGILVRKMDRYAIRFLASDTTKIVTAANRYTATETDVTVNAALPATHAVDRAVLLGAQALGNVYGRNQSSEYYFAWHERPYNFDRNLEVAGDCMGGKAKLRFDYPTANGTPEPTDHGVVVIDSAVKL